jgi:two-component system, cell cycle sensor histidine kinase and response regulator CckA
MSDTAFGDAKGRPLHVLVIDDSDDDAALCLRELSRSGYHVTHEQLARAEDLRRAIGQGGWDIVLCDYTMPSFSGVEALRMLRAADTETPFIFVSGTLGEENAVAAVKGGAQDYVIKDNLTRLAPAVNRALHEAEVRRNTQRAEAERRRAETRFRKILEVAPDAIVAVDQLGRVNLCNPAAERMFGFRAGGLTGQVFDLIAPSPFTLAPHGGDAHEYLAQRSDGMPFAVEVSVSELADDDTPLRLAVIRDISERKTLEAQLRQAQKMEAVGQLTGGIAHDLNNLLTAVLGNIELLQEEVVLSPEAADCAEQALAAGRRGAQLIGRLLAFSRRQVLQPKMLELTSRLTAVIDLMRRPLGPQIDMRLEADPQLWDSYIDPAQFEAAIANLAINARDAMPEGGRITIRARNLSIGEGGLQDEQDMGAHLSTDTSIGDGPVEGDYVHLSVIDTGTGIDPEALEKVFEPFFTTKPEGRGSGLGLSMVYGFVKQSGGHVRIISRPGAGTSVDLFLPRALRGKNPETPDDLAHFVSTAGRKAASKTGPGGVATEAVAGSRQARILVVEDDPAVLSAVTMVLNRVGHQVIFAKDGQTALEMLRQDPEIELLFTDVVMANGMFGPDLALEALRLRPDLKILFTSGNPEMAPKNTLKRLDELGTMLPKPWRMPDLARAIDGALSGNVLPFGDDRPKTPLN